MKPGDRVKLEIPKPKSLEKLEKEGVAAVKLIIKTHGIVELESKELTLIRFSPDSSNYAIVKTSDGNEYEVNKGLLKEIE